MAGRAALAFIFVADVTEPENRAAISWARANPLGSLRFLRAHRELFGFADVSFLYNFGHTVFPRVFVLWASYQYG